MTDTFFALASESSADSSYTKPHPRWVRISPGTSIMRVKCSPVSIHAPGSLRAAVGMLAFLFAVPDSDEWTEADRIPHRQ